MLELSLELSPDGLQVRCFHKLHTVEEIMEVGIYVGRGKRGKHGAKNILKHFRFVLFDNSRV